MSVDFAACNLCGNTFCEYNSGDVHCYCGKKWCSKDCAREEGVEFESYHAVSCNYCRKEEVPDNTLIYFVIDNTPFGRSEWVEMYYKANPNG